MEQHHKRLGVLVLGYSGLVLLILALACASVYVMRHVR